MACVLNAETEGCGHVPHLSLSVPENEAMKNGALSLMSGGGLSSSSSLLYDNGLCPICCDVSDGLLSSASSAYVVTTVSVERESSVYCVFKASIRQLPLSSDHASRTCIDM